MRNLLGNIDEIINFNLRLNLSNSLKFYQFSMLETTTSNGVKLINELSKLVHVTLLKKNDNLFTSQIETFDREHKNRNFSISEKEYTSRIAEINDDILLIVNDYGQVQSIVNLEIIQQKVEEIINKLSDSYVGEKAEQHYQFLKTFYSNESLVIADLKMYKQMGLLLNPYYGKHKSDTIKTHQLRHLNFMDNTLVNVEEQAKIKKIDDQLKEVEIEIKGTIIDPFYKTMFEEEMSIKDIAYDPKMDNPNLDKYNGILVFNTDTGEVKSAFVDIAFTFGQNYKRTITYQLKEILDVDNNNNN
jgi:hypothetical protein